MNNKDFIEELAERKISLKDFFDLLNVWEGMRYAEKGTVIRKLVEEEKTKLLSSLEKRGIQYTTVQTMLATKEETWQILLRNAINMRLILISQFILMQVAAQDQKYGYTVIS